MKCYLMGLKHCKNDQFIYVGWVEAFIVAILKETGEIVETDWEDPCYIINYIAKSQSSFLDVLVELEKQSQKILFGSATEEVNGKYNPII